MISEASGQAQEKADKIIASAQEAIESEKKPLLQILNLKWLIFL